LKDSLLEIRMIPIGKLLHRICEAIKDTAKDIGKNIEIEIKGAEIKIDKPVLNHYMNQFFIFFVMLLNMELNFLKKELEKANNQ